MMKPLAIALSEEGRELRGVRADDGEIKPMYNVKVFRCVTINPPCTRNIS
jgi:hypothetical protein